MLRHKNRLIALLLTLCMSVSLLSFPASAEGSTCTGTLSVQYGQTEARSMLAMVNEFRTGSDAWYWNSDNTEKVYVSGLEELTYDYALEQTAMLRAAEIALSFAHTRPNGESCFTAFPSGWRSLGENIAAGYQTASAAFVGWREDDDDYAGQGHRRNMLSSSFNRIGIGHAYVNGYHFWTQSLGYYTSANPTTAANNSVTLVTVEYDGNSFTTTLSGLSAQYSHEVGSSVALPEVSAAISGSSTWPTGSITLAASPTWSVANPTIATVSGGTLKCLKAGTTTLTATQGGSTVSATLTVTPPANGWSQENGSWYFYEDGARHTGWLQSSGAWYYLDANGVMTTGWQNVNGTWYYLGTNGVMTTGWQKVNGTWYYLGTNGAMTTGWQNVNGAWYYLGANGAMTTGWQSVNGTWYYLGANGVMTTGWQKVNGTWYYLGTNGAMTTGWQKVNGAWYYLGANGAMTTGWQKIGGTWYYLGTNGVMTTGWQKVNGTWYYLGTNGAMVTGWLQLGSNRYYLKSSGAMACSETLTIDGISYTFDANGHPVQNSSSGSSSSGSGSSGYAGISDSTTVYVSRNGVIHTRNNCSGMKYYTEMTYGQARSRSGYTLCDNCFH